MPNDSVQRSIIRQGFVVLLLAFLTGFGIVAGGPRARGWMATHLTLMLTAVFIVLVGLVWNRLVLSGRQRAVLRFAVVFDGYWSLLSGVFATLFAIPGPATGGGAQPAGWQAAVFFTVFIPVLTILPFVFTGLVLYGLRGSGPAD
ncbi:MAG TPA: hypothetical protein VNO55_08525 [Polyangia bacterium]|nr:hypothetical protein [Polyangia bacterium]